MDANTPETENLPSTSSLQQAPQDPLQKPPLPGESSVLADTESSGGSAVQSDVEIKGTLRAENDLIFDGAFEGEIISAGELTLGPSANVHGEVRTRSLNIFGRVQGKVFVEDTCKLFPSAVLMGDLRAAYLVLEKGASFIGRSQVGPAQPPADVFENQSESPEGMENSVPAKTAKRQTAKKPRKRKKT
jgi:cytoskeletal protein CcmA (bactofilin family)